MHPVFLQGGQRVVMGFPGGAVLNHPPDSDVRQSRSLGWEIPWRRERQPISVSLPGKFHGQKSLAGYSPWVAEESDITERLRQQQILRKGGLCTHVNGLTETKQSAEMGSAKVSALYNSWLKPVSAFNTFTSLPEAKGEVTIVSEYLTKVHFKS